MQPLGIFDILKQVFTSWQVIAVTLAILLYIRMVNHVSKSYHPPKVKKIKAANKKQAKQEPAQDEGPEEVASSDDSNEELGLEEMK